MNSVEVEQLYGRFYARLKQFILNRVGDEAAAEDLLHDVFLKIHQRIDTLKDSSKLESWMFQIARNAIIDHYRSRKDEKVEVDMAEIPGDEEEISAEQRLAPAVREMIEQLPEPYREALRIVELEGISQKELAALVGLSFSGAKSRVQRGRAMLQDLLMRCCHFEFDQRGTLVDYHPISCCCCEQSH